MVVLVIFHRKANNDGVEKRRIVHHGITSTKVVADVEFEFVGTTGPGTAIEQRLVCAAIAVGHRLDHRFTLLSQRKQAYRDTGSGTACRRIENVRGQSSHWPLLPLCPEYCPAAIIL